MELAGGSAKVRGREGAFISVGETKVASACCSQASKLWKHEADPAAWAKFKALPEPFGFFLPRKGGLQPGGELRGPVGPALSGMLSTKTDRASARRAEMLTVPGAQISAHGACSLQRFLMSVLSRGKCPSFGAPPAAAWARSWGFSLHGISRQSKPRT